MDGVRGAGRFVWVLCVVGGCASGEGPEAAGGEVALKEGEVVPLMAPFAGDPPRPIQREACDLDHPVRIGALCCRRDYSRCYEPFPRGGCEEGAVASSDLYEHTEFNCTSQFCDGTQQDRPGHDFVHRTEYDVCRNGRWEPLCTEESGSVQFCDVSHYDCPAGCELKQGFISTPGKPRRYYQTTCPSVASTDPGDEVPAATVLDPARMIARPDQEAAETAAIDHAAEVRARMEASALECGPSSTGAPTTATD